MYQHLAEKRLSVHIFPHDELLHSNVPTGKTSSFEMDDLSEPTPFPTDFTLETDDTIGQFVTIRKKGNGLPQRLCTC